MKRHLSGLWLAVLAVLILLAQVAFGEDWRCRNGKLYRDVRYMRHNLSSVQFAHSSGISIEKFSNLPKDVQERYGYDPQKEKDARLKHQKELEEQQRREQELQEERERQEAQRQREWLEQQAEIQKLRKYECLEVKTNDIRGYVTVDIKKSPTPKSFDTSVFFLVGSESISVSFISSRDVSYGWRFLNYHEVYFLIDGKRWHPNEQYDSDILSLSNTLYERISISIALERMESIVHAQSVRFQVGGEEFHWSQEQLDSMGLLLEYIHENYDIDEIIEKQRQERERMEERYGDLLAL